MYLNNNKWFFEWPKSKIAKKMEWDKWIQIKNQKKYKIFLFIILSIKNKWGYWGK